MIVVTWWGRVVSLTLLTFYFQNKIHLISTGQVAGGLDSEASLVECLREMFLPSPTVGVKLSGYPTGITATNQTDAQGAGTHRRVYFATTITRR